MPHAARDLMRLQSSSRRPSLHGRRKGRRHRPRSSPQYSRHGGRPEGGWAYGPLHADPRCMAVVREGGTAYNPPPNIYGVAVERWEDTPTVPAEPRRLAIVREGAPPTILPSPPIFATRWSSGAPIFAARRPTGERVCLRHSPDDPRPVVFSWPLSGRGGSPRSILPRHSRRDGRPGRGCASGTPPVNPRPVAFVRRGGAARQRSFPHHLRCGDRPGRGCSSGTPPTDPRPVASVGEGGTAGNPSPILRGTAVVREEGVPPACPPPTLLP